MENSVVDLPHAIDLLIGLAVVLAAGLSMRALRMLGLWTPEDSWDPVQKWQQLNGARKTAVIVAYLMSIGFFQFALLEASAWQASVGKHLMKIHVTDLGGNRLTLLRSFLRAAAKCLFNFIPYVGFASMGSVLGSERRQALHDFPVKTVVRQGPPLGGAIEIWRLPLAFGMQYASLVLTFLWTFQSANSGP